MTNDPAALAVQWAQNGRKVALATVVATWGSAPRGVGSQLVIDADGVMEGSVSGGCVEGAVVLAAMDAITDQGRPRSIRLCVLVDRGSREFPICPDFVGESFQTSTVEEIRVKLLPDDQEDCVWLVEVEEKK